MSRSPRVLIAGLFHETHCFVDDLTGWDDFETRVGEEILTGSGDSSPLGGVLEFAGKAGWEVVPAIDCRAMPSGMVQDEVVERFWALFQEAWADSGASVDAIYLVLHGAMVSESIPDVEGEILGRLRALPGASHLPVFGVFDLHGNVSPAMTERADCLIAYRENPHTDAREAAVRAASLLERCLESGVIPSMSLRQTDLVWIPSRTATAADPMMTLEKIARRGESAGDSIWAINVASGFAYADTPDLGVSFQVVSEGKSESGGTTLDQLESVARELDESIPEIDEGSPEAVIALLKSEPVEGVTILVEPSDNIGGGAPGDMTGLFRALLSADVGRVGVCLNDPESVAELAEHAIGEQVSVNLGGKGSRLDAGPVPLVVELVARSNGEFELEDCHSHLASVSGDRFRMGPCALVRHADMTILLTSIRTPPFDLGQWRSQGVDPESLDVIVVKAAVAHRRAYDPIAARMIWVETPGPCTARLDRLPYRHASF